ncbi:MAG: EpsG family protein [Chitinophagaceae bacterium]|nr:EpsG family protein [Chitinophagaceae bacterium]
MIFLTVIFFVLSMLSVLDIVHTRYRNVIYAVTGVFLFCVAAFRAPTVDRDYPNYMRLFNSNLIVGKAFVEPTFIWISDFVHRFLFANPVFLFAIYAAIGIATKLIAIRKLTNSVFASLLLYFSYSFTLHEMTQIRAGVALGFVLLSIQPLYERKGLKFLLFASLALLFHYSAIVVFFMWFLKPDKINVTFYAGLIFASYAAYFFSGVFLTDILSFLPQGDLAGKLIRYEGENGRALNIFNAWQIMRCLISFFFLYKINVIREKNKYAVLFLKIYILATVTFVLLASNPTFAGRISDLFSIVDIVLLPCFITLIHPKVTGLIIVFIIAFLYLALNLYYNKIISS